MNIDYNTIAFYFMLGFLFFIILKSSKPSVITLKKEKIDERNILDSYTPSYYNVGTIPELREACYMQDLHESSKRPMLYRGGYRL